MFCADAPGINEMGKRKEMRDKYIGKNKLYCECSKNSKDFITYCQCEVNKCGGEDKINI